MTRQRELIMVAALEDYKLAFPHVLNLLPVTFHRINSELRSTVSRKRQIKYSKNNRTTHKICRTSVILLFALPLLLGFIYSLIQLWDAESLLVSSIFYAGSFIALVITIQTIFLVNQEWVVLHKKEFYE